MTTTQPVVYSAASLTGSGGEAVAFQSTNSYSLLGSSIVVRVSNPGDIEAVPSLQVNIGLMGTVSGDWIGFVISSGGLNANVSSWPSAIPFNSAAHRYFKVSELSNRVSFSVSSDGGVWNSLWAVDTSWLETSAPYPFSVGSWTIKLGAYTGSGETNSTTVIFEELAYTTVPS